MSLFILLVEMLIGQVTRENICLKILNIELSCDPAIPFLGISKGSKTTILKRYLQCHVYCSIIQCS